MPECLACGHNEFKKWAVALDEEYFTSKDTFTYFRCSRCEALFIDPVPKDRLEEIYPANYYSFDEKINGSIIFKIKDWLDQRFFKKQMSTLLQQSLSVLDVGGGNGQQLSALKKVDARINHTVVVDLDKNAGDKARQRGHEYFCGAFETYHSETKFDVILMLNIIEHVDNPAELLHKAQSLLSPQGIVIIKTPNTDSLDAKLFQHHNWGGYHCPRHWVLFNKNNLESLINSSGLRVDHFTYTQGAPFWSTTIAYFLARHKIIRVSQDRPVPKHPLYGLLNIFFAAFELLRSQFAKTSQMLFIIKHN